jgi:hypothetical protein
MKSQKAPYDTQRVGSAADVISAALLGGYHRDCDWRRWLLRQRRRRRRPDCPGILHFPYWRVAAR